MWSDLVPPESIPVAIENWPTSPGPYINLSRADIKCEAQARTEGAYNGEGEIRGLRFKLTGCQGFFSVEFDGNGPCSSSGAPQGTIVTEPLYATPGVIKAGATPKEDKVGLAFTPEAGPEATFFEATCHNATARAFGSVIVPVRINKMLTKQKLKFLKKPPRSFEGGPEQVLHTHLSGNGYTSDAIGHFEAGDGLYTPRALELRDCKPGC